MTVTGGFGGTFGSIFGTTTVVSPGGGHAAMKAAMGQAQNDNTFWTVVQNRWNNNFTPGGTPMPFHWNNTFSYSDLANQFGTLGVHQLIRQRADAGLSNIINGSDDATWLNLGTWAQQLFDAQGPSFVPISRPFLEFDGDWFNWALRFPGNSVLLFNRAFRHACAKIRQNCPSMRFALCGDLGYTGVNVGDTSDFSLWDQVMDGVSGEPGIAEYISVTDTDTYDNGGPMGPSPWIENALVNWKNWAISRGLQMGHGEWGIGQLPQSGGNHFYSPKQWADIYQNFWVGLPVSGPGSLLYINLFDEGVIDGSVDWRGVSYVSGTFPGTSGVDGTNVANALKSAALTIDTGINVNGTGLLTGGGALSASGSQSVILLSAHPEVDPTGTNDCSDQLQAIINSAPQGTVIRAQAGATYRVDQSGSNSGPVNDSGATLVFDNTRNFIQFDGNGCTFTQTVDGPYPLARRNLHRSFFSFLGADHCKVFNATFIGSNPNNGTVYDSRYEQQHVFNLEGVNDFEAYGITASHNWGDYCAMLPDATTGVSCSTISLHDYTYHDNGRDHQTWAGVTDLLVERANAYNISHTHIDLAPSATSLALKPQIKRCTVRNSTLGLMRLSLFAASSTQPADVDTITFDANSFYQWKMTDVEGPWIGTRRKNLSFTNNTVLSGSTG